jgi:hypothetical protein
MRFRGVQQDERIRHMDIMIIKIGEKRIRIAKSLSILLPY